MRLRVYVCMCVCIRVCDISAAGHSVCLSAQRIELDKGAHKVKDIQPQLDKLWPHPISHPLQRPLPRPAHFALQICLINIIMA